MNRINNNGFTLIEAIVGGMITAICALMLVTGFIASTNVINKSSAIAKKAAAASSVIEAATVSEPDIVKSITTGTMTFNIESDSYEITGDFTAAYDNTTSVGFVIFDSDS